MPEWASPVGSLKLKTGLFGGPFFYWFFCYTVAMKIKYFQDTDTLYIEFKSTDVSESRDLDENTLLDLDAEGNVCGITVEHARDRADIPQFSFEQIAA